MHPSASIRYNLKGHDKERRGLISANYQVGKKSPLSFAQFISALVGTACEFAVDTGLIETTEELQAQLQEAFDWSRGIIVEELDQDDTVRDTLIQREEGE